MVIGWEQVNKSQTVHKVEIGPLHYQSHGTELVMLGRKLPSGTSKTKEFVRVYWVQKVAIKLHIYH